MNLTFELVIKPSENFRKILMRRMPDADKQNPPVMGAVLLIQGQVAQILAALDIAVKASSVRGYEVVGNCPQHINTIAIIGNVAQVKQALNALKDGGKLK